MASVTELPHVALALLWHHKSTRRRKWRKRLYDTMRNKTATLAAGQDMGGGSLRKRRESPDATERLKD